MSDKSYKTAFVDDFRAIAILLNDGEKIDAFKVNIPSRKAEKLRNHFNTKHGIKFTEKEQS